MRPETLAPLAGLEEAHAQPTRAGTSSAFHPPSPGASQAEGPGRTLLGVTWRLKSLCSSPFLGGAGGWPFQSRSGGTEPSMPKTFSSWKHSVSTI